MDFLETPEKLAARVCAQPVKGWQRVLISEIHTRDELVRKLAFSDRSRRGGLIGGRVRAIMLSPARRSEIAKMGATAREKKRARAELARIQEVLRNQK